MANVRDQIIDALITDMANDDLTWRPVDLDAEYRARSYVAADIAANRSTTAPVDESSGPDSQRPDMASCWCSPTSASNRR